VKLNTDFLPKDFIETGEGLIFAVVQAGIEHSDGKNKVLCFLRYIRGDKNTGRLRKLETFAANDYLKEHYPRYLHHSLLLDTDLHAVEINRIHQHYQPKNRLQQLLNQPSMDKVERDCYDLCRLYSEEVVDLTNLGITGSLLIGSQGADSDIDIVVYDRELFHYLRTVNGRLIGQAKLSLLQPKDWREAYNRRACSLSFEEYLWHEQRKLNKALVNGRKFDLNFVGGDKADEIIPYHKLVSMSLEARVTDADHAFDYPAEYKIDHPRIAAVVSFTATYNGQALAGEKILVSGLLEQSEDGAQRIIVGSSREAPGEFIKVVDKHP
jgi:uncharacterized protein